MDSSNNNNYLAGRKESGIYGRRSLVRSNKTPIHSKVDAARLKFTKEKANSKIGSHRAYEKRENASKRFKIRRNVARNLKVIADVDDDSKDVVTFVKDEIPVPSPVDYITLLDKYIHQYPDDIYLSYIIRMVSKM